MQGDVLEVTPMLQEVLSHAHPHFLNEKYSGFMILTQTCDLVRRDSVACGSRYINLAVIRPLSAIMPVLLDRACKKIDNVKLREGRVYCLKSRARADMLLERIVNQNEQAMGLFYLHPDADAKIAEPSVAMLPVSIALRAEHYDALLKSRSARLGEGFRGKLGWLIGNLYSRIATQDWEKETAKRAQEIIANMDDLLWVDEQRLQGVLQQVPSSKSAETVSQLKTLLNEYNPPTRLQKSLQCIETHLKGLLPEEASASVIGKLKARLQNDLGFKDQLKPQ